MLLLPKLLAALNGLPLQARLHDVRVLPELRRLLLTNRFVVRRAKFLLNCVGGFGARVSFAVLMWKTTARLREYRKRRRQHEENGKCALGGRT